MSELELEKLRLLASAVNQQPHAPCVRLVLDDDIKRHAPLPEILLMLLGGRTLIEFLPNVECAKVKGDAVPQQGG
jgi:hypothetical protein